MTPLQCSDLDVLAASLVGALLRGAVSKLRVRADMPRRGCVLQPKVAPPALLRVGLASPSIKLHRKPPSPELEKKIRE